MSIITELADLLVKGKDEEALNLAKDFLAKADYLDSLKLCHAAELFALHGLYARELLDGANHLVAYEYEGTERRLEMQYIEDLRKNILSYLVGHEGGLLGRLKYKANIWNDRGNRVGVNQEFISKRSLRNFLSYCSADKNSVRELYRQLKNEGVDVWLDVEKLLPGQDWQMEIKRAIRRADVVIVCLSNASVNKVGFVQKEIRLALDVADEQPEGKIFIIPLRLEDCEVPERLRRWQWVNYFEPRAFQRLAFTLQVLLVELAKTS
jgi:hypothetical protein